MKKHYLSIVVPMLMVANSSVFAEDELPNTTFEALTIKAIYPDAETEYLISTAPTLLKSNASLYETPRSVSVMTEEQLKQKQATTLTEALKGVSSVSTGQNGRRGWDDFVIRGQLANSQVMIDGMRTATSSNYLNSFDVSGLESVEVIKGPDSVGFGPLMPAGVVNLTTKKPKAKSFQEVSVSTGSFGFLQGAFDVNYARNNTTDGAFRINGRVAQSDDPTDEVYFKNYYLAPSYHKKIGNNTDITLLASYQGREYIRQQGMPTQNDTYKKYDRSTFFGDPNRKIDDESLRLGYQLNHKLNDSWKLKQNFAFTKRKADGEAVIARAIKGNIVSGDVMNRSFNDQTKEDTIFSLDTNVSRSYQLGDTNHDVQLGVDAFRERSDYQFYTCNYGSINLATMVANHACTGAMRTHNNTALNHFGYTGLYAKDNMRLKGFDEYSNWLVNLGGRYDWSKVESDSVNLGFSEKSDKAFTGNASVMYDWHGMVAPYVSYATSFLPNTDKGKNGVLDAEKGNQVEVGIKLQSLDQRIQGALSYYDLTRKNVAEPIDITGDVYGLVGKQKTKGYEAEIKAMLNDQWNVSASYSYIPTAEIVEAGAGTTTYYAGQRINHVPKNAYSLATQYYFDPSHQGWYVGGMYRHEDEHHAERDNTKVTLPSYDLLDVEAGYNADKWNVGVVVQNVFDKAYYSGTSPNATMVTYGDPRAVRVKFDYKF